MTGFRGGTSLDLQAQKVTQMWLGKEKNAKISDLRSHHKKQEKGEQSQPKGQKEGICEVKRRKINEIENRETIEKITETKSRFLKD